MYTNGTRNDLISLRIFFINLSNICSKQRLHTCIIKVSLSKDLGVQTALVGGGTINKNAQRYYITCMHGMGFNE